MTLKQRYDAILGYFRDNVPIAESELHFDSPYQLLVAVILSAQCTDRRVNMTTPALFSAYPTPEALAEASEEDVFELIRSISYPNNKARHLVGMARRLTADFGGQVPTDVDALMSLPGVGRKTANVMLGQAFGKAAIAVDTHVLRVSNRLGLANGKTPLEVEKTLTRHIPAELRFKAHHWILLHGRYVCKALKPQCPDCGLQQWCKSWQKKASRKA